MRKQYIFFGFIGFATVLFAENFIVKKAKQIIVNYDDQWCDLFGKLIQLFADFDMQRSTLQKKGIKEIMCTFESGTDLAFSQLSKVQQKEAVVALQDIIEQLGKATRMLNEYNKKMETWSVQAAKIKK